MGLKTTFDEVEDFLSEMRADAKKSLVDRKIIRTSWDFQWQWGSESRKDVDLYFYSSYSVNGELIQLTCYLGEDGWWGGASESDVKRNHEGFKKLLKIESKIKKMANVLSLEVRHGKQSSSK